MKKAFPEFSSSQETPISAGFSSSQIIAPLHGPIIGFEWVPSYALQWLKEGWWMLTGQLSSDLSSFGMKSVRDSEEINLRSDCSFLLVESQALSPLKEYSLLEKALTECAASECSSFLDFSADLSVFLIVTLGDSGSGKNLGKENPEKGLWKATVNLKAPVIVNEKRHHLKQIILPPPDLSTEAPLIF